MEENAAPAGIGSPFQRSRRSNSAQASCQETAEAFLVEMAIIRERVRNSLVAHDYEARSVSERVRFVGSSFQQFDGFNVQWRIDEDHAC
jgi:hypothetical protein